MRTDELLAASCEKKLNSRREKKSDFRIHRYQICYSLSFLLGGNPTCQFSRSSSNSYTLYHGPVHIPYTLV